MQYSYWIDQIIYDQLDKGSIHFNEILRIINNNRPKGTKDVTRTTLSQHLYAMVEQDIIWKDRSEKGHKGSYEFMESVRVLRKINAFQGVKSERDGYDFDESKHPDRVLRKILRKILYAKGVGIDRYVRKEIADAGDILISDQAHEVHTHPSFSENDIIANQPVSFTNITFSSNVRIKDEDVTRLIDFCKDQLRIGDPAIFDDSPFNMTEFKKTRKIIREYLSICCEISAYIIIRLQSTWAHIRKYKKSELIWYSETLGQDKLLHFLEYEIKKMKNDAKKLIQHKTELRKEFNKEVTRRISVYDQLISARQKELSDLLDKIDVKYHSICDVINDFSYPKFMRNLILNNEI